MRVVSVLFLFWIAVVQGSHEKDHVDAFCSPADDLAVIIQEERRVVDAKIENKNATYFKHFDEILVSLDTIIPQINSIVTEAGVDMERKLTSLRNKLAAVSEDPAVPFAKSYQSNLSEFVQVLGLFIGRGATNIPKYFQDSIKVYKDLMPLLSAGIIQDVIKAYDIVEKYNAADNPNATICTCTKLRSFANRGLGFFDAAGECGNRYFGEILTLSKITNDLLIIGRDGLFRILDDGAGCFNHTATVWNNETKALLNTCLEVERYQCSGFTQIYRDLSDSDIYGYVKGKAKLITDKFVTCTKTVAFGFVPSYVEYTSKYIGCVAPNDPRIPSNLLDLVKVNDQLSKGYLISDV